MSFGPIKVFTLALSAGGTSTAAITFPVGTKSAYLEVPTLSTGADLRLLASTDGSQYRNVMQEIVATSSVQINTFTIASAVAASPGRFVPIPLAAPYMKVEVTTLVSSAANFKIICHF